MLLKNFTLVLHYSAVPPSPMMPTAPENQPPSPPPPPPAPPEVIEHSSPCGPLSDDIVMTHEEVARLGPSCAFENNELLTATFFKPCMYKRGSAGTSIHSINVRLKAVRLKYDRSIHTTG